MSFCYPIGQYPSALIKDVSQRWIYHAQLLISRRHPISPIKHQNVRCYRTILPITGDAAYIAPSASVVGNVIFGTNSSAMYHAAIRNYHTSDATKIGDGTSILENASFMGSCKVGNNCVVGCGSTLDSCTVHDNVILGTHVNLMIGVVVEQGSIIAAGSTVDRDTRIPANELWAGSPAQKICDVTEEQRATANALVRKHVKQAQLHSVALREHYAEVPTEFTKDWLFEMCQKIDKHHTSVAFEEEIKIPIEGKQFIQPRVAARLPHMQARVSYPVNRMAPHMNRLPDWTGNA